MSDYVQSFTLEDRERVFRFFAVFSRAECALKRYFPKKGKYGEATAGWNDFADAVAAQLSQIGSSAYHDARDYLVTNPPQRQNIVGGRPVWRPNARRDDETDARYLLRVIRDVRNNLFHGGKYEHGAADELARDRSLLDAATIVLAACIKLDARVERVFHEPS